MESGLVSEFTEMRSCSRNMDCTSHSCMPPNSWEFKQADVVGKEMLGLDEYNRCISEKRAKADWMGFASSMMKGRGGAVPSKICAAGIRTHMHMCMHACMHAGSMPARMHACMCQYIGICICINTSTSDPEKWGQAYSGTVRERYGHTRDKDIWDKLESWVEDVGEARGAIIRIHDLVCMHAHACMNARAHVFLLYVCTCTARY